MSQSEQPHYRILMHRTAQKILDRLPQNLLRRIAATSDDLATEPRPMGCRKLAGRYDHHRVRVGDWCITYTIQDDMLVITIVEIAPRGNAYRTL